MMALIVSVTLAASVVYGQALPAEAVAPGCVVAEPVEAVGAAFVLTKTDTYRKLPPSIETMPPDWLCSSKKVFAVPFFAGVVKLTEISSVLPAGV